MYTLTTKDGWLYITGSNGKPRLVTQTTATADEWHRRLVDSGLFCAGVDGLHPTANYYPDTYQDRDIRELAGYYTYLGNAADPGTFAAELSDDGPWHLPYAALAWIDHGIREWAADEARCNVNWAGECAVDIGRKARDIMNDACKRFAHDNPDCAHHGNGTCAPGQVRTYNFGDNEEAPIALCRGCFHAALSCCGEIGHRDKLTLVDGALVADQWTEADVPAPEATSAE